MAEAPDVDATVRKLESLLDDIGEADPRFRQQAEEVVRLLMELYGSALSRVIAITGAETALRLADDKLVSSLLLLHGLHPVDPQTRATEALRRVERRVDGHRLYLAGLDGNVARVRVDWQGEAAPNGLAAAIEGAIAEAAPDIAAVEIEGLPEPPTALVQIALAAVPTEKAAG